MKIVPHLSYILGGACLALLASTGWAQVKDPLRLDNVPVFTSTSNDAVLLRYKLKTGQVEKLVMDIDVDMRMRQGGQEMTMKQAMRMEGKARVTSVDAEGNMAVLMKITRMTMKVSAGREIEFDSDKPTEDANFKPLMAMINVGIPCKMSPVGKMLETDLEPLRLAVRRADAALAKSLEDSTKQMFEGTYIQLSERPIKAGETYKAGTVLTDKAKVHNSYKIRAVSADKTQVLLEPVPVLEMLPNAFPPGLDAKIKNQRVAGWLLFDLQKGYASKADLRMQLVFEVGGGSVEITTKTVVTSNVE